MVLTSSELDPPAQLTQLDDDVEVVVVTADGLADALPGARALFLWDFFSAALQEAWHAADTLEWIHVAAAGVDSLLFDDLRESSVVITNAHGVFDRPIAEFVLASILAFDKGLHENMRLQREHTWKHRETVLLTGQRVLVVGTGAIGREIARLHSAVGCQVRGAGRREVAEDPDFGTVLRSDALADHIGWADHVVNAAPLTPGTTALFDATVFSQMKPGAHFVNIGRGASVVQQDLVQALESGRLGGASLDVLDEEPLGAASGLWDTPGLAISAHLSGDVAGWRDSLADQFLLNARTWLAGGPLSTVVDKRLGYVPRTSNRGEGRP